MTTTTTTTTVRLDQRLREALALLTADGTSQSEAIRAAILAAERQARLGELRQWAADVANDPKDRAEIARVRERMDEIRAR